MERTTRTCSTSLPKIILKDFQADLQSDVLGILYHKNHTNYQIVKSKKLLHRDSLGRNQQEQQTSIRMAGKYAGCKNSQPCEISRGLRNFATLAKLAGVCFFFSACFSFFLLPFGSVAVCSN